MCIGVVTIQMSGGGAERSADHSALIWDNHHPNGHQGGREGAWKESVPGIEGSKDPESRYSKALGRGES